MAEKKKSVPVVAAPTTDKKKALETAIARIEKDYGKGTIMRLGDDIPVNVESPCQPVRSLSTSPSASAASPADVSSRYTAPRLPVRLPLRSTSSLPRRKTAAKRRTSTLSTRWSRHMPGRSAWI